MFGKAHGLKLIENLYDHLRVGVSPLGRLADHVKVLLLDDTARGPGKPRLAAAKADEVVLTYRCRDIFKLVQLEDLGEVRQYGQAKAVG